MKNHPVRMTVMRILPLIGEPNTCERAWQMFWYLWGYDLKMLTRKCDVSSDPNWNPPYQSLLYRFCIDILRLRRVELSIMNIVNIPWISVNNKFSTKFSCIRLQNSETNLFHFYLEEMNLINWFLSALAISVACLATKRLYLLKMDPKPKRRYWYGNGFLDR